MATVNKDFKIKSGLVVEGLQGTINGEVILTENAGDQYILDLIGGETLVKSVESTQLEVDANGKLAVKSEVFDPYGSAAQAYTDALADANSYTNGEITTALQTAQGYANDAEADAILAAQQYTDGEISDEVTARNAAILLAKNDAIAEAAADATTKANAALADAEDYTDAAIASEVTRSNSYADQAELDAISSANSYTDGEITSEATRADAYADQVALTAENNAKAYADGLSSGLNWKQAVHLLYDAAIPVLSGSGASQLIIDGHDPLGDADSGYRVLITQSSDAGIYVYNSTGGNWTLTRSEDADAFAELVGAAVFVMEGTNYGSTAWVQAEHYLSSFSGQSWTQFSGQGTYLAGNGIVLDGTTFSIDTAVTATKAYADGVADDAETAANAYTDGRESAITTAYQNYADQAELDAVATANSHTDAREIAITTAYEGYADGVALTAEQNAKSYADDLVADEVVDRNNAINNAVNALTTSDIEEGTNLYFTDARAKTSAADLLTGATLTNITITGTGAGLTITAENGVADSTTDDLAEGEDNLYFTDGRAINAIQMTTPNFATVEIDSVAKQVAATLSAPTAGIQVAHAFAKADYRSAEYLVKVAYGTHTEISKVLLTLDSSDNIAITEYGIVGTNGSASSVSAGISGANVQLQVTTANNNSTVTVMGTLLV